MFYWWWWEGYGVTNWGKILENYVLGLGQIDEKGEQLENQKFGKKCFIFGVEKGE